VSPQEVDGVFALAGVPILRKWRLENKYWPDYYVKERTASPWWLVKTSIGLIELGWRKRVISVDWGETPVRRLIGSNDVTRTETMIHAWSIEDCVRHIRDIHSEVPETKDGKEVIQNEEGQR